MKETSAATHEFCRGKVDGDGSCLYTSFRYVNGSIDAIDNKRLRILVANFIREHKNLHPEVLESGTSCKTVEEYCTEIEKHNLWGGEPEIRALTMISRTLIRLVSRTKTAQGKYVTTILNYGEDVELFKECVFILYDQENKHYDPLYVINKENLVEKLTIFRRDDEEVSKLLGKFIREELHYDGSIQLDCHNPSYVPDRPTTASLVYEAEITPDMIFPMASMRSPVKRKLPDYAGLSLAQTVAKELTTWIPSNNDVSDLPAKFSKWDISEKPIVDDDDCQCLTVEQHLQTNFRAVEYNTTMVQQPTIGFSMISLQNDPEAEMKFEVELALEFRGRTPGDFKPTKAKKRNGKPAVARPPRYFRDRNNDPSFNLLIPERYLSPNAEYCLKVYIVTREIHGCTYIHPYFKFQAHPTDKSIPDENPLPVLFNLAELKDHSKGIKQLLLQFVVVMLKNPQLMQSEQPLPICCSSTNASPITTKYDNQCAFKKAYHLHDLRFAVTLWKRQPGETDFHQCDGIQYISQISTENINTKIRN